MNAPESTPPDPRWRRWAAVLMGAAAALHLLVFLFVDLRDPDAFLRADRARIRLRSIEGLLGGLQQGVPFGELVGRFDLFFDYGLHAGAWSLGGAPAVIGAQCVLAVLAVGAVTFIAFALFPGRPRLAIAGTALYVLLPQSIAFPHQLLTEAVANPLLVLGIGTFFAAWLSTGDRTRLAVLAGALLALASLVRPALVLVPFTLAIALWLVRRGALAGPSVAPRRGTGAMLAAFVAVLMAWSLTLFALTGHFRTKESSQDLGTNFAMSAAAVLLNQGKVPEGVDPLTVLPERIPASEYLGYVKQYPAGFASLYLNNALVVAADSGIGRLYVDLLGLGLEGRRALQDPQTGWRPMLTNHGPVAMLRHGLEVAPGPIAAGVIGVLLFGVIDLALLLAYWQLVRAVLTRRSLSLDAARRGLLLFLALLPPYVLVTSQVVAYAASRHRSQVEFAWILFALWGAAAVFGRRTRDT